MGGRGLDEWAGMMQGPNLVYPRNQQKGFKQGVNCILERCLWLLCRR